MTYTTESLSALKLSEVKAITSDLWAWERQMKVEYSHTLIAAQALWNGVKAFRLAILA